MNLSFFKTRLEKPEESKTDIGDKPSTKTVSSDLGSQIDEGSIPYIGDKPSTKTVSCDFGSPIDEGMSMCSMSKYVDDTGYFSSSLIKQVVISEDGKIPNIMFDCIEQLQERGIEMKGIFRTSGNHLKIEETRKQLEAGKEVNFRDLDIKIVACILKRWLRELPTPLIPFTCYSELLALGATVKKVTKEEELACMDKVRRIIVTIHNPEKECLRFLMKFLHKVAKKSEVNKMDPKNLATVMAPNIMYKKPAEDKAINALAWREDFDSTIEIISRLIEDVEFFFLEKDKEE